MYAVDCKELKKLMIDHDLPGCVELSRRTGINRNTLSQVLEGKIFPSSKVIVKVAKALEMDSNQIGNIFFKQKVS